MAADAPIESPGLDQVRAFRDRFQAARQQADTTRLGASLVEGLGVSDEAQETIRRIKPERLVAEQPVTAQTLSEPRVAEVAGDEVEELNALERVLGEMRQRFQLGSVNVQLGRLGAEAIFDDDERRERRIAQLQRRQSRLNTDFGLPDRGAAGFVAGIPGATAEMLPMMADTVVSGVEAGLVGAAGAGAVGAAATAPVGGSGALATAPAGFTTGAALGSTFAAARMEAGLAHLELRAVTDENGQPVDPRVAGAMALAVGGVNGALERFGLSKLLKDVPGADRVLGAIGREGAKKALQNATIRRLATAAATGATVEGITEAAQESTLVVATLAEMYANGRSLEDFSLEVDGETLTGGDAVWARVLSAFVQGAQGGAGVAVVGSQAGAIARAETIQNAVETAKWLGGVSETALRSKLREINPEAFKDHVERSAEGGVESVMLDADAVHAWLNEASPDESRAMVDSVEAFRLQFQEVSQSGGPYVVSMADYLTHIVPSGMRATAQENARLEAQAMTEREAQLADQGLPPDFDSTPDEIDFVTGQPVSATQPIDQTIREAQELSEQAGIAFTPFSIARKSAQDAVNATRVRDLSPHRYRVQAAKEARLAQQAIEAGDAAQAQLHKRRQLFNQFAENDARRAREETANAARFFQRAQTKAAKERLGKAGEDYLAQVDALLDRFDLRLSTPLKRIDQRLSLRDWIVEQEANGETVIIPNQLRDEAFTKSWKSLTVQELTDLKHAIANIEQIARRKTQLILAREEAEMDDVRFELIESAETHLRSRTDSQNMNPDRAEQLRDQLLSADASLRKAEFLVDQLDGGDPSGPWRRYVFTPLAEAEAERNDLNAAYTAQFAELAEGLMKGKAAEYKTKQFYPELGFRLNKQELLSIALNMGNDSNLEKLLAGYGWNAETVQAVLDRELGAADWQFVQGVWDLIESLWPRIVDQQRKLVGVVPEKVQPREFENAHGSFRGGYYPVVYDGDKARFAFKNESRGLFENTEAAFKKAITGHGFTVERTKITGPLRLDLTIIPGHLDQVIHDLTHRDVLMQIDALLEHEAIHDAVGRTLGKPFARLFRPWLQGIATDRVVQDRGLDTIQKWSRMARQNLTTFTLGFRYMTLLAQVAGYTNGVAVLRQHLPNSRKYLLKGLHKAYAGHGLLRMQAAWEHAAESSGEMRHRIGQIDKDMRDVLRRQMGQSDAPAWAKRTAMQLIGKVQMIAVDLPIWFAAYEGAVEVHGFDHRRAVEFADSVVRMSQGSAGAKDLSAIQRSDEGWRQLLLFFTWRNTLYNQLASTLSTVRKDGSRARRVSSMVLMVGLPAVYGGLIRGEFDDEDDEWGIAREMIRLGASEMLGTLPLVDWAGAASPFLGGPRFGSQTPAQRIANVAGDAIGDVAEVVTSEERDADLEMTLSLARLLGLATGAPLGDPLSKLEEVVED